MCQDCDKFIEELKGEKPLDRIKGRLEEVRAEQRVLEIERLRLIVEAEKIDPHWQIRMPDGSLHPDAGMWPKEKSYECDCHDCQDVD